MGEDRQAVPMAQPVEGATTVQSLSPAAPDRSADVEAGSGASVVSASSPPSRESSESGSGRRRHALRIPDDEISRPNLAPEGGARPQASSEPAFPAVDPSRPQVTPTRIITISEPPPPDPGDPQNRSESEAESDLRFPADMVPDAEPTTPRMMAPLDLESDDEVEVQFEDDFALPLTPRVVLSPPSTPPPPATAIPIPTPTPTPIPTLESPAARSQADSAADEAYAADDAGRRSDPGEVPEVAAEDVVALDTLPAGPASPVAPMRVRAVSPPAFVPVSKVPLSRGLRPSLVIVPPRVGSMPSQPTDASGARRKPRLWWELFNDDYLRAAEKVTDAQIGREVTFVEESLGVERNGTLLDLACGTGRHATELARRGYEVVGFDLSLAMLARAGEDAQERGAKLNFVQGDMREMAFEEQFDGVYCWSTSFGYFEEDKNCNVVERIGRALKAGGRFLLDVVNRDFLIRHAPSLAWFEGDGCVCMDEMNVDFITSRLKVKRTVMLDDGRSREIEYSIRVYSLHELGKILHEQGFKVREVSGRVETPGVFFGDESPRTIILAEKS
jgi:SAM-dependent methyltransferase